MFEIKSFIDISHNEAVSKEKIYYCEDNNVLLSDFRPGNLFWDFHCCNMQQQDFTIEEYWSEMTERFAERNKVRSKYILDK